MGFAQFPALATVEYCDRTFEIIRVTYDQVMDQGEPFDPPDFDTKTGKDLPREQYEADVEKLDRFLNANSNVNWDGRCQGTVLWERTPATTTKGAG